MAEVTELLHRWGEGDASAFDELMPLVYAELKTLARGFVRRERAGATMDTTALVHEAFLRLVDQKQTNWKARPYFFGAAAKVMRRLLVDNARARNAAKRGLGITPEAIDLDLVAALEPDLDVLAVDIALDDLAAMDPGRAQLVELRYFGGFSMEEAAEILEISISSANRDWAVARAWLYRRLRGTAEIR